jgi:hypothetical protein
MTSKEKAAPKRPKPNASAGGKARAATMTPQEKSESARKAAEAKWAKAREGTAEDIPSAKFGSPDRPLKIGSIEIPCYVLDDGRRVLVTRGLQQGIGMSTGGGTGGAQRLARFVARLEGKGIEVAELTARIERPIKFKIETSVGAAIAHGYEATILADICDAVLQVRKLEKGLQKQQLHIAEQCELLMRGFSRVGIIALVDEATGYQDLRTRNALADILEKFIAKELRPWMRTFEPDFYREMFRLRGWQYQPLSMKRPGAAAHFTNDIVYDRLAPAVRAELKRVTEEHRREHGLRKRPHLHRGLSKDIGHPKLKEHLTVVTVLMQVSSTWTAFMKSLDKVRPRYGQTLAFSFMDEVQADDAEMRGAEADIEST